MTDTVQDGAIGERLDFPMRRSCPVAPPPEYARLRQGPPRKVRVRNGSELWLLTRYEDVALALKDPRCSMDELQPGFPQRLNSSVVIPRAQSFWRMDPPEHTRLRKMAMPEFTLRGARRWRPAIEELTERLLDEFLAGPNPADLVAGFALQLPARVIARIFGVPETDTEFFTDCTRRLLAQDGDPDDVFRSVVEVTEYLDRLGRQRAADPKDDLISRLEREHVATGEIEHEEAVAIARMMLIAGHETTAKQIALSVLILLENPDQRAQLEADPTLMPAAIDELLRFWSISEDNVVRCAIEDFELSGAQIKSGDGMILAIPAANHDETVFPDPDRFDIHRDASKHIAFGSGPHYCPGATLATQEVEIALTRVFARMPQLALAVPFEELRFTFPTLVYGLRELPVTW